MNTNSIHLVPARVSVYKHFWLGVYMHGYWLLYAHDELKSIRVNGYNVMNAHTKLKRTNTSKQKLHEEPIAKSETANWHTSDSFTSQICSALITTI